MENSTLSPEQLDAILRNIDDLAKLRNNKEVLSKILNETPEVNKFLLQLDVSRFKNGSSNGISQSNPPSLKTLNPFATLAPGIPGDGQKPLATGYPLVVDDSLMNARPLGLSFADPGSIGSTNFAPPIFSDNIKKSESTPERKSEFPNSNSWSLQQENFNIRPDLEFRKTKSEIPLMEKKLSTNSENLTMKKTSNDLFYQKKPQTTTSTAPEPNFGKLHSQKDSEVIFEKKPRSISDVFAQTQIASDKWTKAPEEVSTRSKIMETVPKKMDMPLIQPERSEMVPELFLEKQNFGPERSEIHRQEKFPKSEIFHEKKPEKSKSSEIQKTIHEIPEIPEVKPGTPEFSKIPHEFPKIPHETPKITPDFSKIPHEFPKILYETPKITPGVPKITPDIIKITPETPAEPSLRIVFRVKCQTEWGQELYIVGSDVVLGQWQPQRGIKLSYMEDFFWQSSEQLFYRKFEYKYIIKTIDPPRFVWEEGKNRISPPGPGNYVVVEIWNQDDRNFLALPKTEKISSSPSMGWKGGKEVKVPEEPKIPKVTFKVKCPTEWGQEVFMVGTGPELGDWDPQKGQRLSYVRDFWWESPPLQLSKEQEYKYVLISKSSEPLWETGKNRIPPIGEDNVVAVELFAKPEDRQCTTIPKPVVVMSFNIRVDVPTDQHKWTDRKFVITEIIERKSPDLIGLQEPEHHQLQDILRLNPAYSHVGIGRSGGENGEYSAILYKRSRFHVESSGTFWLSNTPERLSQDWGSACLRICTWAKMTDKQNPRLAQLVMYNTHLDHISKEAKHKGLLVILENMKNYRNMPLVLTGDFNTTPEDPLMDLLPAASLVSIHNVAKEQVDAHMGTLTGWSPSHNNQTIDYILVNDKLVCERYEVITDFDTRSTLASDHRPILGRISYKEQ